MNIVDPRRTCSRYVKPEKLDNLRTKQEIELMNGRPWTRELPPPPVLPPFGPLEKISGRLDAFSSEYFREYFDVKAYRTSTQPAVSDGKRGAAAAVAIAAGSPGLGTAIMAESDSSNHSAEYVQGSINGKPFRGWVGVTRVQAGDTVDIIAEWQQDHYEVYAIVLPEERIVSICPGCDMGRTAHLLWRIKNMCILTALFMLVFICIYFIKTINEVGREGGGIQWFLSIVFSASIFLSGLIAYFAYQACAPTRCKLAEEIFQFLGLKNVSKINLNKVTRKREKQLIAEGNWHDPGDKDKPACPSSKFIYSGESWFYY